MEPNQLITVALIAGLSWAGQSARRSWLGNRREIKLAESQSRQVTDALATLRFVQEKDAERMALIQEITGAHQINQRVKDEAGTAKHSLVRHKQIRCWTTETFGESPVPFQREIPFV